MKCAKLNVFFGISMAMIIGIGTMTTTLSNCAADDNLSPGDIFKKAQENYASLTSYTDGGKIVATMGGTTTITSFTIRLARTNFYYIEWHRNGKSDSILDAGFQAV